MNFKVSLITSTLLISLLVPFYSFASGGDTSETNDDPFEGLSDFQRAQRVVDPTYESGKAIYTGRNKSVPKLSYCLRNGEEIVALKRKTIKNFKKSSYSELARNLYQCDTPDSTIKSQLESKQFLHVLYYLNKRYKLNLQRS